MADLNAYKMQGPDGAGNVVPCNPQGLPPSGSGGITLTQSSANPAAANNVALGGGAGQLTWIAGFEITGGGATGASIITITITGLLVTLNYKLAIPAGAAVGVQPLIVEFNPPIPASAVATAITVNVPSFGAGNTDAAATVHGFRQ